MKYYIELNGDGTPKLKSTIYSSRAATTAPLVDITEAVLSPCSGSGKEKVQPRYYIVTDVTGKPVSGTLTTKKPKANNHIDITRVFHKKAVTNPLLFDANVLYAVIVVGHSISTDMSHDVRPTSFANVAFGSNKKVQWNADDTAMEVVDCTLSTPNDRLAQHIFQPTFWGQNNPSVLLTNEIARRVKESTGKSIQFISLSGATNGSVMYNNGYVVSNPELGNNSQWIQYLKQGLQTAKTYATSIGKTLRVPFVLQISGEGESLVWNAIHMDAELLKKNFIRYHRELRAMIAEVTGDSFVPKIYRHQQHMNGGGTDLDNMRNKQAQLELTDPYSPIVFPMTVIDNGAGYEHPGAMGTFKYVGISANNIFRDTYLGGSPVFKPIAFSVVGNSIKVKCAVPVKPIKIDTSRGGTPIEQTFTLYDGGGNEIAVNSVAVSGADELTLNCAASPVGGTLYYKLKRPYLATDPYGRNQADIADSDTATFYGIKTPSFLLSFKQQL